jgi:hypothetical protein
MSEIPTHCFFINFTGRKDVLKILGGAVANLNFVRLAHHAAPIFLRWLVT